MIRDLIGKHITELLVEHNMTKNKFASIINKGEKTAQNKFTKNNWTFEEIEAIEEFFGVKILYSAKEMYAEQEIKAVLQIELKNSQKENILKQLIGKEDLEILNK